MSKTTKTATAPTPVRTDKPNAGGSYRRNPDGSLTLRQSTAPATDRGAFETVSKEP